VPFVKGQSGNPGGRPKADGNIQQLARQHGPEAIAELVRIMREGKSDASRASAAIAILDRGWGKPPQYSSGDAVQFRRAVDLTDDELATIIAQHRQS